MERRGIAAVPVVTRNFAAEAARKAQFLNCAQLPMVIVDHPFAALEPAAVRARAIQALPQVIAALTGKAQEGGS